jgi:hypothetical protein
MPPRNLKAMADAAARRYGVPPSLFRRLIQQESGWNPDAYNPSGATGLVQIHLPSHPDISAEQARDPAFALGWGARYLATQKRRFGRWDLALAAYNAGPGNVENGRWQSFPETQNYVKKIMGGRASVTRSEPTSALPTPRPARKAPPTPAPLPGLLGSIFESNNRLIGLDTPSFLTDLFSSPKLAASTAAPAAPSATGAPTPQEPLARNGQLGGLAELFHDPKGAYDSGQFIKPIGGHDKHLHASVTNPQSMLWLIREAQRRGYRVRENPYVDPVDPVHTTGSFHGRNFPGKYDGKQLGQGVDISGGDLGALYDLILNRFGVKR